jgi:hypothetical protein
MCPLSSGEVTRRVHLVREGGSTLLPQFSTRKFPEHRTQALRASCTRTRTQPHPHPLHSLTTAPTAHRAPRAARRSPPASVRAVLWLKVLPILLRNVRPDQRTVPEARGPLPHGALAAPPAACPRVVPECRALFGPPRGPPEDVVALLKLRVRPLHRSERCVQWRQPETAGNAGLARRAGKTRHLDLPRRVVPVVGVAPEVRVVRWRRPVVLIESLYTSPRGRRGRHAVNDTGRDIRDWSGWGGGAGQPTLCIMPS